MMKTVNAPVTDSVVTFQHNTIIGPLTIALTDNALVRIQFSAPESSVTAALHSPLAKEVCAQLDAYFSGQLRQFDLPLAPVGTVFQQQVWLALSSIPYGETRSYGELATLINKPSAARAVGMANNHNPLPIVIPCHRVIGSDGRLVGYAGGLAVKQALLALENGELPPPSHTSLTPNAR